MKKIYIYGASGHGVVVADIARACGYEEIGFVDDGENEHPTFDEIKHDRTVPVALGIGNNRIREILYNKLVEHGFEVATLIHPSAVVSPSATIGKGSVVMPQVIVNAHSTIGNGVILNSGCIIEHDNHLGDFVHISPAAALAGNVTIGHHTHIGIGSSIIQEVSVGKACVVGAGSVVVNHIDDGYLCYGNPCKQIKEIQ